MKHFTFLREGVKKLNIFGDMSPKLWPTRPLLFLFLYKYFKRGENTEDFFYIYIKNSWNAVLFFYFIWKSFNGRGSTSPLIGNMSSNILVYFLGFCYLSRRETLWSCGPWHGWAPRHGQTRESLPRKEGFWSTVFLKFNHFLMEYVAECLLNHKWIYYREIYFFPWQYLTEFTCKSCIWRFRFA